MLEFNAVTRKWGNSIGVTLPSKIIEDGKIQPNKEIKFLVVEKKVDLRKIFGSLKLKKSTQKIKDEMREGWDPEH